MAAAQKSSATPLPTKLASLLREAKWLVLVALAAYLLLILATFHKEDPGWSHSATVAVTQNAGGRLGAWLADLLLYLFGVSAYWWAALCAYVVVWGYRRIDGRRLIDRRPLAIAFAGFVLLLLSSAALEALRLQSLPAELPLAAGGMVGAVGGPPEHRRVRLHRRDARAAHPGRGRVQPVHRNLLAGGIRSHRLPARVRVRARAAHLGAAQGPQAGRDRARGAGLRGRGRAQARGGPPAAAHRAFDRGDQEVRARPEGEAGAAVRRPARYPAAPAQAARRGRGTTPSRSPPRRWSSPRA